MPTRSRPTPLPLSLTPAEKADLKLLYLAKFAPAPNQAAATRDDLYPSLSAYHFELFKTLRGLGVDAVPMSDLAGALSRITDFNYIFSVQNSAPFRNSEVMISAVAECYGIRYLGAPPNVRALAEDKYLANRFASQIGIRVAWSIPVSRDRPLTAAPPFPGPYIIKPRFGVNSENMSDDCVQDLWSDLAKPWRLLDELNLEAVIEEFIPGDNYGAPYVEAVGPEVLPIVSEVHLGGRNVLTSSHKQNTSVFDRRVTISSGEIFAALSASNKLIRREVGPCDYFRTDWRVHERTGLPHLVEINICCSIARGSGIAKACYELGWSYEDMIETILASSLRRKPSAR